MKELEEKPAFRFDPLFAAGGPSPPCLWDTDAPAAWDFSSLADAEREPETVVDLLGQIHAGQRSPREIVDEFRNRIRRYNTRYNAFISVVGEVEDEPPPSLGLQPLSGIPFGVKDVIGTAGLPTTAGSKVRVDLGEEDATVVRKLRQAGAVLLGKLNTHEFAAGGTGENVHFGSPQNPWNLERIPGGSSSGAGVAVAAGMIPFAVGTDTGGSVRIPAACCGVVGFKPTYGRIDLRGVIPLAWSLDHAGIISRSALDAGCVAEVVAGVFMPLALSRRRRPLSETTVGVPESWLADAAEEIQDAFDESLRVACELGATLRTVQLPAPVELAQLNRVIAYAETSTWHADTYPRYWCLYGANIRGRLEAGFEITAVAYLQAQRQRARWCREVSSWWHEVHAMMVPTLAAPVPTWEEARGVDLIRFTALANLLGAPAITTPCGVDGNQMPVGVQIVGPPGCDGRVLGIGAALEAGLGRFPAPPVSADGEHREKPTRN